MCEKKHNYFVHVLIRLQVHQAYACIIELCPFLHAISKSCMNGVTRCVCMHAFTHLAFKQPEPKKKEPCQ